jgi:hypothetical protein
MGIYYDGIVYGVGWEIYNYDEKCYDKRFEKQFETKMTLENIAEVKAEFDNLSDTEKEKCSYYVITSCATTYDENTDPFFTRYAFTRVRLERFFENGFDNDIF